MNTNEKMNRENKNETRRKQQPVYKQCDCQKKESVGYSFYSKLLQKPFDTVEELLIAEESVRAAQRAKEDKAAQKKADATAVEDAFKALNAARRVYKKDLTAATEEYSKKLAALKSAFETRTAEIKAALAAAEAAYQTALKNFADKYPEGYHITLKDGDFETTIHRGTTPMNTVKVPDLFDIFLNW